MYRLLFLGCTFLLSIAAQGQDIHFSQFYEAPLLRNPSLAGIFTGDIRVQAVYRDQWNSVTDAYKTSSLNAEYKKPIGKGDDFVTLGMQLLYDRAGTVSWVSMHAMPALNYHKSLSANVNRYLSLGVMGGLVQRRFDRSKMTTNSQYDGLGDGENFPSTQYTYADGAVGLSFNSQLNENPDNNFFIGAAFHHFNRPKNSFYRDQSVELDPKWVGSAGVKFSVTPASYITLQADYSRQGQFQEVVAGALYGLKLGDDWDKPLYTIHGGAFLRWNDAFIPALKIDYHPFSVSFSYDVNISKLKSSSYGRGGFELAVSYIGFLDRERSAIHALYCPRF
ncbi:MAG: PorP/SprF family type IX secretion system membrane protein [Flavisolibacter sp.]|nr:PorP/SprF family type IX secretion system membrane protein [Flavisolibacter sp.]MBD0283932.1 PorP/SprF family type IX secretion system membrane protein [Flavisolibacter sp.]MBD0296734.1 PorP/SprF family type IX secretion system membrane protein [Flavisolibacter sp.]MBD0367479.1 PorP/SprF family type IX secretion system membrane protein [Flavisolibacter sp.]MBD0376260.1 PorP/SprF family type IX secretion system membrane protein [Flavisolibacter sp.]